MINIVVSGYGWSEFFKVVPNIFQKVIDSQPEHCVIIDADTIYRELNRSSTTSEDVKTFHLIKFGEWMKDGFTRDGILDIFSIRNSSKNLSVDLPVVLDARGRSKELILDALPHLRFAWFPLDKWHPAFIIICDDVLLLPIGKALSETFYCQPVITTEKEMAQHAREILRSARFTRWLGGGVGKWQRKIFNRLYALDNKRSEFFDKKNMGR